MTHAGSKFARINFFRSAMTAAFDSILVLVERFKRGVDHEWFVGRIIVIGVVETRGRACVKDAGVMARCGFQTEWHFF